MNPVSKTHVMNFLGRAKNWLTTWGRDGDEPAPSSFVASRWREPSQSGSGLGAHPGPSRESLDELAAEERLSGRFPVSDAYLAEIDAAVIDSGEIDSVEVDLTQNDMAQIDMARNDMSEIDISEMDSAERDSGEIDSVEIDSVEIEPVEIEPVEIDSPETDSIGTDAEPMLRDANAATRTH